MAFEDVLGTLVGVLFFGFIFQPIVWLITFNWVFLPLALPVLLWLLIATKVVDLPWRKVI